MDTTRREKILLIEDDEKVYQPLKCRLESVGFEVHVKDCGTTGLSYAAEYRPDLVILDLKLPDMGGYEVCKKIRKLYHHWVMPILMLTGMDEPIDQLRGFAHGADAYLTKPYEPAELLKTVKLLLGEITPIRQSRGGTNGGKTVPLD